MFYAEVGVKHVQEYLGRSRHLWGRRGASDLLVLVTWTKQELEGEKKGLTADVGLKTVHEIVKQHSGVEINPDALDIDGVVAIRSSDRKKLEAAAHAIALNVRQFLPATTVSVDLFEAQSYAETLAFDFHRSTTIYQPGLTEFPLARRCDECNSDMANYTVECPSTPAIRKGSRLCADCWQRMPRPNRTTVLRLLQDLPGFEAEEIVLRKLLCKRKSRKKGTGISGGGLSACKDFHDLAAQVKTQEGHRTITNNHIATVFADGNGLGQLFARERNEAATTGSMKQIKTLSSEIKGITRKALIKAVGEITQDADQVMPAIPHILGGDDIFVSVPATRVWDFLPLFLRRMKKGFETKGLKPMPSVSAGVVICHAAFPIGDQAEISEALMRQAKKHVAGDGWSFNWIDITAEGPQPLRERSPWLLREFEDRREALESLRDLPNSARSSLRTVLRQPGNRNLALKHFMERSPEVDRVVSRLFPSAGGTPGKGDFRILETDFQILDDSLSITRWLQ